MLIVRPLFPNRPFRVKHFQTIHHCSVDVARGLALLFGIGTKAPPSWDSKNEVKQFLPRPYGARAKLGPVAGQKPQRNGCPPFWPILTPPSLDSQWPFCSRRCANTSPSSAVALPAGAGG